MTRRPMRFVMLAVLLFAAAVRDAVPIVGQGGSAVPRIQFEKYSLPNGLEVILSQDRAMPRVAVNIWYHVGPANEEAGRTGFAHLFEHMMFQGSKHVPSDSHFKILEGAGASSVNGTTGLDRTNYYETVPSNQLELALWLESDRMGYLLDVLDAAQLANQQDVVRNERRQSHENVPYGMSEEVFGQKLFPAGHPYHAQIIGSHADIQAATLDNVKRFFKQYYVPNNASLAIVGDFDKAATKALVNKYFGSLKRGAPVPPVKVDMPKIASEQKVTVADRIQLPRVQIGWITPPFFQPGDADADMAATILAGGRSSRLYQSLVYEKRIAQDVSAYQMSGMVSSTFQIQATARPGHTVDELQTAIDEELVKFAKGGPDARELERARNVFFTSMVNSVEELNRRADRLNMYNHYLRTPDYFAQDARRYQTATTDSVARFVREQLTANTRVVVHTVPGAPAVWPSAPAPKPSAAKPGEGTEAVNAAEPWRMKQPTPGPERPLRIPPPITSELPNGLRLILSERRGLPIASASLVVTTGSDANPVDRPGLANFTAAMLDEGTATRSAQQIAADVAQLGASLSTGSSMDATTISTTALKSNFRAALDIAADVVLRPSFPADEIDRQRAQRLAQITQQLDSPQQLAQLVAASVVYGDKHPYGHAEIGTEASVKVVTRQEMVDFWKTHFVPGNAALIVAGDISMAELRTAAQKSFGAWAKGPSVSRPPVPDAPASGVKVVVVNKPGAPQSQVRVQSTAPPRSTPDYAVLRVLNHMLGGTFSSRINMNLREQHGYTYGANSQFTFRKGPGPFTVASGVRTDVTAPAVGEIFKEIGKIREAQVGDDELKRAKDALMLSLPAGFATNEAAIANFSSVFLYGLGDEYFSKYPEQIRVVTAGQVLDAAKKYLVPDRLAIVAVGDAAQIEPELRKLNLGPVEVRNPDGTVR